MPNTEWRRTPEGDEVFVVALDARAMREVWLALRAERAATMADRARRAANAASPDRAAFETLALGFRLAWLDELIDNFDPARVRGQGIADHGGPREMGRAGDPRDGKEP